MHKKPFAFLSVTGSAEVILSGAKDISFQKTRPAGSNQAAPAARANIRLLLLPSGPDKIHSMTPHGTQSSSPTD